MGRLPRVLSAMAAGRPPGSIRARQRLPSLVAERRRVGRAFCALWALNIAEGTRESEGGRYWDVEVMHADQARVEIKDRREAERRHSEAAQTDQDAKTLTDSMGKLRGPETKNVIRDRAGLGNGKRFEAAWAALLNDGTVTQDGTTRRGNGQEYPAFRLFRKPGEV